MSIGLYCDGIKVSRRSVWVSNAFEFSVEWTNKIKNVLNVVASSATQAECKAIVNKALLVTVAPILVLSSPVLIMASPRIDSAISDTFTRILRGFDNPGAQAKQESRYIVISQTVKTQAIADDWAIIES